jgi:monoamine oxidase
MYQAKTPALAGRRLRNREVRADMGGYAAELLSKAISTHALDAPLTADDRAALIEYLRRAGALDEQSTYKGTPRRGYASPPGAGDAAGTPSAPLPLGDLLGSKTGLYLQGEYLTQSTMLQVVGGTDRLAAAFAARLGDRMLYGAEVIEIRQSPEGVSAVYRRDGEVHTARAAFAVCAMPLPVLASLNVGHFDTEVKKAMASVPYASAGKIGLQFSRRFWEEDDRIFGGISKTDQDITQIVYPSSGYLGRKGVLVGYYQNGAKAAAMAARTPAERLELALAQGELIHPPYRQAFETSFSVSWQNVRWNRGGWAQYSPDARRATYPMFLRPDGRLYFAGDHVSYLTGWMAGALESAQQVATAIHARASKERSAAA